MKAEPRRRVRGRRPGRVGAGQAVDEARGRAALRNVGGPGPALARPGRGPDRGVHVRRQGRGALPRSRRRKETGGHMGCRSLFADWPSRSGPAEQHLLVPVGAPVATGGDACRRTLAPPQVGCYCTRAASLGLNELVRMYSQYGACTYERRTSLRMTHDHVCRATCSTTVQTVWKTFVSSAIGATNLGIGNTGESCNWERGRHTQPGSGRGSQSTTSAGMRSSS